MLGYKNFCLCLMRSTLMWLCMVDEALRAPLVLKALKALKVHKVHKVCLATVQLVVAQGRKVLKVHKAHKVQLAPMVHLVRGVM